MNECLTGAHQCEQGSTTCSNQPGSYSCKCKNGYVSGQSPYKCEGKKYVLFFGLNSKTLLALTFSYGSLCLVKNTICIAFVFTLTRLNSPLQSTSLSDVNECLTGAHKCEQDSTTCNNQLGSYSCKCKKGYLPGQSLYKCESKKYVLLFILDSEMLLASTLLCSREGTPLYGLYRYVRPQRVWFSAVLVINRVSIIAIFLQLW